jgi:hypothetical protein
VVGGRTSSGGAVARSSPKLASSDASPPAPLIRVPGVGGGGGGGAL